MEQIKVAQEDQYFIHIYSKFLQEQFFKANIHKAIRLSIMEFNRDARNQMRNILDYFHPHGIRKIKKIAWLLEIDYRERLDLFQSPFMQVHNFSIMKVE